MAGYTWADVGTTRLPFDQFVSFVFHAPVGTAVFHERTQGWTVGDYLLTDILEMQDLLLWSKTKDARKNRNRPKRRPRPTAAGKKTGGKPQADDKNQNQNQVMTVAEYVKRTGMTIELEGR